MNYNNNNNMNVKIEQTNSENVASASVVGSVHVKLTVGMFWFR